VKEKGRREEKKESENYYFLAKHVFLAKSELKKNPSFIGNFQLPTFFYNFSLFKNSVNNS
jgi:hypothetical protein